MSEFGPSPSEIPKDEAPDTDEQAPAAPDDSRSGEEGEVVDEPEKPDPDELRRDAESDSKKGADQARSDIAGMPDSAPPAAADKPARATKEGFIAKHLPDHLKKFNPRNPVRSLINAAVRQFVVKEKPRGVENIPVGPPKIFIVTHQKGEGEAFVTSATAPEPIHFATANAVNWQGGGLKQWFQRQMGMLPIRESMSKLTDETKDSVVAGAPEGERVAHQEVADRGAGTSNTEFFRAAVALLMKGENVGIFPEGLLTRIDPSEHQREAYPGFALIAKMYRQQTGEDVQIVPVAVSKGRAVYGEPFTIAADVDKSRWSGLGTNALRDVSSEFGEGQENGFKQFNPDGSEIQAEEPVSEQITE